jgi:hypothetical protein
LFEAESSPRWSAGVGPLPSSFLCLAGVMTIKVKRLPHVIHPFFGFVDTTTFDCLIRLGRAIIANGRRKRLSAIRGRRLPFDRISLTPFPAVFLAVAVFAFGFAGDIFFVTFEAVGFMTLGGATFLAAALLDAAFFLVVFLGVEGTTSSIRRSGLPGKDLVSERVLRVDCEIVVALVDCDFGFWTHIRMSATKGEAYSTLTPFWEGENIGVIPPKSRGRDSLSMTSLDVGFVSSVIAPRVVVRPGVVALMGEPYRAGVVARDTAIFGAVSTKETRQEVRKWNREAEDGFDVKTPSAVIASIGERSKCAARSRKDA